MDEIFLINLCIYRKGKLENEFYLLVLYLSFLKNWKENFKIVELTSKIEYLDAYRFIYIFR